MFLLLMFVNQFPLSLNVFENGLGCSLRVRVV